MQIEGIKFKCSLIKYGELPLHKLRHDFGLVVDYYDGCCIIRSQDFEGEPVEVRDKYAFSIIENIVTKGLN